jgi:digeranylgeranylglycerophospholipid reductase
MIAIIGAGPVGSYAASLLAGDFEVKVFEEHPGVGLPVQCTGIVTQEIFNFIPKRSNFVLNKVDEIRILSPNNKFLKLSLDKPDIILDRQKFDQYFYNLARKNGAEFFFSHRFIKDQGSVAFIKDLKSGKLKKFKFSHLIGADGPLSPVAKDAGIFGNKKFFTGIQAVVKKRNSNIIDFYPVKGGFGWAVPEDRNTLRIGVASEANPREQFNHLLKRYKGKVVAKQGGIIPIFNPAASVRKENVFLAGDAAGFVKATTGGGLVPGLQSAEILAKSIIRSQSYEAGAYLKIYPSLLLNLQMRNIMNTFDQKDWNELIRDLNNSSSKKALQNINRDRLFQLLLNISISNPSILKYGFKHLPDLF